MTELRFDVPEEIVERLAERAKREHTTPERLAGEAVRSYLGPILEAPKRLRFVGLGRSGRSDISERAEEILNQQFGR